MDWHELVGQNYGLAVKIARQFTPKNLDERDDYIQQALVGLVQAAQTYSPNRGRFSTYAGRCIYNSLFRYVAKNQKFHKHHRRLNERNY